MTLVSGIPLDFFFLVNPVFLLTSTGNLLIMDDRAVHCLHAERHRHP